MLEEHLRTLAENFQFPFNHLDKSVQIDLDPPFVCQLMTPTHLRLFARLPNLASTSKEEQIQEFMQLNLALMATNNLCIGLAGEEHLTLSSDIHYELSYKMLVEHIETFANHLSTLSAMLERTHNKSAS